MLGKFSVSVMFLFLVLNSMTADGLKCYHCLNDGCKAGNAEMTECGKTSTTTVCTTQVKTGAPNNEIAVRKCAIADKNNQVPCPPGYTCTTCTEDLCNTASTSFKINYYTMIVGVMVTLNYFLSFRF